MKKYHYALSISPSLSQNNFKQCYTPKAAKNQYQNVFLKKQPSKCVANLTQQALPKLTLQNHQTIKKVREFNCQGIVSARMTQSTLKQNCQQFRQVVTGESLYSHSRSGSIRRGNNSTQYYQQLNHLSSRNMHEQSNHQKRQLSSRQLSLQVQANPPKNNQTLNTRKFNCRKNYNLSTTLSSQIIKNLKENQPGRIKKNNSIIQAQISFKKSHSSKFLFESPNLRKYNHQSNKEEHQNIFDYPSYSVQNSSRQQLKKKIIENSAILQKFNSKIMLLNEKNNNYEKETSKNGKKRQLSQGHQKFFLQSPKPKKTKKMSLLDEDIINQKQNVTPAKCCFCQNLQSLKQDFNNQNVLKYKYVPCSAQKLLKRSPSVQDILKEKTLDRNKSERRNILREGFYCPLTSSDYKAIVQQGYKQQNHSSMCRDMLKKQYQDIVGNEEQWKQKLKKKFQNVQLRKSFTPSPSPRLSKVGPCSPYTQKSPMLLSKYHKLLPQFEDIIYEQQSDLQQQQSMKNVKSNKLSIKHHLFIFNILDKSKLKVVNKDNCQIEQLTDCLKCFIGQILGKIKFKNQSYSFERFNQQLFDISQQLDAKQLKKVRSQIIRIYKKLIKPNQKDGPQISRFSQSSQIETESESICSRVFQSLLTDRQILQNSKCSVKELNLSNFSTQYNAQSIVVQRACAQQYTFPNQIGHFSNKIQEIQRVLNQKNDRISNIQNKIQICEQTKSKKCSPSKISKQNNYSGSYSKQQSSLCFKRTSKKQAQLSKTCNSLSKIPFQNSPFCKKISVNEINK